MRRFVIVSYDISEPKRWRKVFAIMKDHGEHVQYSVFLCQLTGKDEVALKTSLEQVIRHDEDQILFARLGPVDSKAIQRDLSVIGREYMPRNLHRLIY